MNLIKMKENQSKNLLQRPPSSAGQEASLARPPIVVVMGHIDHGKTSLLDHIKKTNVAGREAGGITQSIGAYEIWHMPTQINADQQSAQISADKNQRESAFSEGKKITFIDTPGHEAFSKMRARGAQVADLAILVVASDDGVKPQTEESIKILRETNTSFIAALNKIDKSGADVEKTKQELLKAGVLLEGFGGNVSWQAISAKTGEGVSELLDLILLAAEVEGLTFDPQVPASGVIIESKMDKRRGLAAIAIIENGTLKISDEIKTQTSSGRVKILENFLGERVDELSPSSPALILGFETPPQIGEEFFCGEAESPKTEPALSMVEPAKISKEGKQEAGVRLILKADVSGSLEALVESVKAFKEAQIFDSSIGEITDGDIKSASATGAIILGFRTKTTKAAENLAKGQNVKIITSEVIYELLKSLDDEIQKIKEPPVLGELLVLKTFSQKGRKQIIGGRVSEGSLKNNSQLKVFRQETELGFGRILNIQKDKKDVGEIAAGNECGLLFDSEVEIKEGDKLIYQP